MVPSKRYRRHFIYLLRVHAWLLRFPDAREDASTGSCSPGFLIVGDGITWGNREPFPIALMDHACDDRDLADVVRHMCHRSQQCLCNGVWFAANVDRLRDRIVVHHRDCRFERGPADMEMI